MEFSIDVFCVHFVCKLNNFHFKGKALWREVILLFSMVLAHRNADLSWAILFHLALLMKERRLTKDVLVLVCAECSFEDDF